MMRPGFGIWRTLYLEIKRRLLEAIRQKHTEWWKNQLWIMHTTMVVREFFTKNKTVIMPQLPNSTDLAPAGFFLFPKLKAPTKGMRLAMIEKVKEESKQKLLAIPNNEFQKCFEDWKKCWYKCIISEGGLTLKGKR